MNKGRDLTNHCVKGVSLVIPTYNRACLLRPTLASVKKLVVPTGLAVELVVIDNMCTDETADVVAEASVDSPISIRHVIEEKQGLCYGRNRALSEANYEHVVYLDDDIEIGEEWLYGYVEAVESLGADCVVGPVTPKFEGELPSYFSERVISSVSSSYSRKGKEMKVLGADVAHQVPGCNFGVKREVGKKIGGFNNGLDRVGSGLLAGGDTEFGMRLSMDGRVVVYHPKCSIFHIITNDKLTCDYLRRRWTGLGATIRALDAKSENLSFVRRWMYMLGVARLWCKSFLLRSVGNRRSGFQAELEARRGWGFLQSRCVVDYQFSSTCGCPD